MLFLSILGAIIVLLVFHDFLWTTFSASSNGFITRWSTRVIGKFASLLYETFPWTRNHFHAFAEITIGAILLTWYIGTWAGWALIFSNIPIVQASKQSDVSHVGERITPADVIYYTGTAFFTLGLGDYTVDPGETFWRIMSNVCAAEGILLSIITVTYLLAAVEAAATTCTFANILVCMGGSPTHILVNAWNPRTKSFGSLESALLDVSDDLGIERQNYILYPVLFTYSFSTGKPAYDSSPPRIAALDDLLTILLHAVDPAYTPSRYILQTTRMALTAYLDTLSSARINSAETAPPPPDLTWLREKGLPVIINDDMWKRICEREDIQKRRCFLLGLVVRCGHNWDDVVSITWPEKSEQHLW
ncbi:hypothetical protein SpCBS45565_g02041 [Spizellomyces sp. 'palustris']|nr:hypothetical protein SpCBS45565_g02041 [Spizellomyces sp. 'palustris']